MAKVSALSESTAAHLFIPMMLTAKLAVWTASFVEESNSTLILVSGTHKPSSLGSRHTLTHKTDDS